MGHQGLFFYAFSTSGSPMATSATGLYYNRNRWYSPSMGRFLSRDPHGSGSVILRAEYNSACPCEAVNHGFEPEEHFSNGLNLYQALGSSPLNYLDPFGTDMLDDEGIMLDSQMTWGLATSQISAASGSLYLGANVFTGIANGFLSWTGGTGRGWIEKMDDCVRKYDPAALAAGSLASLTLMPYPKAWLPPYRVVDKSRASGSLTTLASSMAGAMERAGWIGKATVRGMRTFGRITSPIATAYNLMLAGTELFCGGSVIILGYDPGRP